MTRKLVCKWCNEIFEAPVKKGTPPGFCSKKCKNKAKNKRARELKKNKQTEANIKINPYYLRRGNPNKITKGYNIFEGN